MIFEAILTTLDDSGKAHITPLGYRWSDDKVILAPFVPSRTEENLRHSGQAVINLTDDVRIFAGCITDRRDWPLEESQQVTVPRLSNAMAHLEVEVDQIEEDELRPRFICKIKYQQTCKPFRGFNRAQSAVLEAAILVSRLKMLSTEKINQEIEYLSIAIEKTAGEHERLAWGWLMESIHEFQQADATEVDGA